MKNRILLCLVAFATTTAVAQLSIDISYKIISSATRSKLLTGGNPVTGHTEVVCLTDGAQHANWRVETVPGGFYKIKNASTGKYLAVSGASIDAGAGIILWDDVGQPDIIWKVIQSGDARTGFSYKFRNRHSNLFLAIEGGSTANGAAAIQWTDEGQPDISWRMEGKPELAVHEVAPPSTSSPDGSLTMPKANWQPLFTTALAGFKLELNNYTPTPAEGASNTYKFQRPNDNFFRFNELEHRFPIMPMRMDPATIYFINLKSTRPAISTFRNQLVIELPFGIRSGYEILANCIDNISCGGGMWWINVNRLKVSIFLTPVIEDGKITYSNTSVRVSGAVSSAGLNVVVQNFNNGALFRQLGGKINQVLQLPEVKQLFTDGFHQALSRTSASRSGEPIVLPFSSISVLTNGDLKFER
jgi:Ricin-type beta-trefoil lectin domain-like